MASFCRIHEYNRSTEQRPEVEWCNRKCRRATNILQSSDKLEPTNLYSTSEVRDRTHLDFYGF